MQLLNGTTIDSKQFKRWTKALRSGKYKQGRQALEMGGKFCCLGVACKLLIPAEDQLRLPEGSLAGGLPSSQPNAPEWLKEISNDVAERLNNGLVRLNDKENLTFDEIADVLELIYVHKAMD